MEVRTEYPNKDAFLVALKWYIFKNSVNYFVTKCAMRNKRYKWKIMVSLGKKIELWTIKKYSSPHTCVTVGAIQNHSNLD